MGEAAVVEPCGVEVEVVAALVQTLVLSTEVVMVVLESVLLGINYRRLLCHISQK